MMALVDHTILFSCSNGGARSSVNGRDVEP